MRYINAANVAPWACLALQSRQLADNLVPALYCLALTTAQPPLAPDLCTSNVVQQLQQQQQPPAADLQQAQLLGVNCISTLPKQLTSCAVKSHLHVALCCSTAELL